MRAWFAAGCPRDNVAAIAAWRQANLRTTPAAESGDATPADQANLTPRAKLECAKLAEEVRAKKLKNDQLAGRLVPRDDVLRDAAEFVQRIKCRIEQIPATLEPAVPAKLRATLLPEIENQFRLVLQEMAAWAPADSASS